MDDLSITTGLRRVDDLPVELWGVQEVLAVVAHPDDESFGLGGLLAWMTERGVTVDLVCFTAGEASTIGASPQLAAVRAGELQAAAEVLGVRHARMEGLGDGRLAEDRGRLAELVEARLDDAEALVCLEPSGVTGHPDHQAVAAAAEAVADRAGLPVIEWGLAPAVAAALGDELGVSLNGFDGPDVLDVRVERARQRAAIACHESQDPTNPLLARRLHLQGDTERIRVRSAAFAGRLARFVAAAGSLARPDATLAERARLLDLLVGFTAGATWPAGAFDPDPDPERPYGVHCLHDDPAGWNIAAVVLAGGRATPPHDHDSWGAAATVAGVERNTRFAGRCPDQLRPLDTQLIPHGSGYVFDAGDIHQASDATGLLTVSVHLLVKGGHDAHQHQRCREEISPPTSPAGEHRA